MAEIIRAEEEGVVVIQARTQRPKSKQRRDSALPADKQTDPVLCGFQTPPLRTTRYLHTDEVLPTPEVDQSNRETPCDLSQCALPCPKCGEGEIREESKGDEYIHVVCGG